MNIFIIIFTGYLLILTETTLWPISLTGLIRPDGLMALVVWCGIKTPLPDGLTAILGLGLIAEAFTITSKGLYMISFTIGYLMVRYILSHVITPYLWQRMLLVSFVSTICLAVLLTGSGNTDLIWPWGIAQAILNGVSSPLYFLLFDKILGWAHYFIPARKK
ncbi:MAG: hypothetical protein ACUVQ6_07480 [Dissulfurimicrobium sp.]|uniref:hypothetical protein n=1 Tax=Dissulfurimicrobium sp. TaxID=2022436 RepID=UPI00404A27AF